MGSTVGAVTTCIIKASHRSSDPRWFQLDSRSCNIPLGLSEVAMNKVQRFTGSLFCLIRFHDFKVIDRTFEFGSGGVETVECRRCQIIVRRSVN